jgi:hypothetical protein
MFYIRAAVVQSLTWLDLVWLTGVQYLTGTEIFLFFTTSSLRLGRTEPPMLEVVGALSWPEPDKSSPHLLILFKVLFNIIFPPLIIYVMCCPSAIKWHILITDRDENLQVWKVAVNILNKQFQPLLRGSF